MDRLSPVRAAALCAALSSIFGCERESADGGGAAATASPSRVAAVPASEDRRGLADLCDVLPDAASAPALSYPALSDASATPPAEGWRWINLWATWCKPCVEEIPMLRGWAEDLAAQGSPVEMVFVSIDDSADDVEAYAREHANAPTAYRASDSAAALEWVAALGLPGAAIVPVHVVVDPDDRVRCVRAGKVSPRDFSLAQRLIGG